MFLFLCSGNNKCRVVSSAHDLHGESGGGEITSPEFSEDEEEEASSWTDGEASLHEAEDDLTTNENSKTLQQQVRHR